MITIDELMTPKPYALTADDTLEDARLLMTDKNIRHIPIVDKHNHLVGLVTQRDVLKATEPESGQASREVLLSDIMISNVSVIHQTSSVRQAGLFLQQHKYGCLPVVANDKLVGIVTDSDFITVAINLIEQVELTEEDVSYGDDRLEDINMPTLDDEF